MDLGSMLLVGGGAFLAGGMNAMAGGGTFFSFPALLAAGVPPVMANASNTVGLCPASLVSAWAYRREALRHGKWAVLLMIVSATASSEFRWKESIISTVVLGVFSYLAFVKCLELQFPVWPPFLTGQ